MIAEIIGARFKNKGAHLMLLSIINRLSKSPIPFKIVMETGKDDYLERAKHGLYQRPRLKARGFPFDAAIGLAPKKLKRRFGIITSKEVGIVIDASGFRYSDQWGSDKTVKAAKLYRKYAK